MVKVCNLSVQFSLFGHVTPNRTNVDKKITGSLAYREPVKMCSIRV